MHRPTGRERACWTSDGASDAPRGSRSRQLEDTTDRLALSAFDALDDDELEYLFRTLTPLTRNVIAGGDIPASTPMGLSRDDLNDDGAQPALIDLQRGTYMMSPTPTRHTSTVTAGCDSTPPSRRPCGRRSCSR